MKDNFSLHADQYAKFRPNYPQELYDFLLTLTASRQSAWDCATGNGQVAAELAKYFATVYATDLSEKQIENATRLPNIIYKVELSEQTSFPDNFFDLITVAQAIHWFNFNDFYREVNRTIKPDGIIAVIGYVLLHIDAETDKIISKLYHTILAAYWDKERKYIDENYSTIPFPFAEVKAPVLHHTLEWTYDQLLGYLQTWSAVQHFIKTNNTNPVDLIHEDLKQAWKESATKKIKFPLLLRIGRGK